MNPTPVKATYRVKHTFRMSNYETVDVEGSLTFDMVSKDDSFESARKLVDDGLRTDLERVRACSNFSSAESYIYEWIDDVYA